MDLDPEDGHRENLPLQRPCTGMLDTAALKIYFGRYFEAKTHSLVSFYV